MTKFSVLGKELLLGGLASRGLQMSSEVATAVDIPAFSYAADSRCNKQYYRQFLYLLFILMLLPVHRVMAFDDCYFKSGGTVTASISPPATISVKRNAAPGTVIFDSQWVSGGDARVACRGTNTTTLGYSSYTGLTAYGQDVYEGTNPSIGTRVYYSRIGDFSDAVAVGYPRDSSSFYAGSPILYNDYTPTSAFRLQLVVVGPIQAGGIGFTNPVVYTTYGSLQPNRLTVSPTTIIPLSLSCQLNTPIVSVPLGNVYATALTQVGPTSISKDFSVALSCENEAVVSVSLDGVQNPDSADNSVLALTNQGQAGVASGLGVQILKNSTPLSIGEQKVIVNSASASEVIQFDARYYQTKPKVMPGSANATVLLNLTYQ